MEKLKAAGIDPIILVITDWVRSKINLNDLILGDSIFCDIRKFDLSVDSKKIEQLKIVKIDENEPAHINLIPRN